MEIASCILILTLATYLDFADCSSLGPLGLPASAITDQKPPRRDPYWLDLKSNGMLVSVCFDPEQNGKVIDIRLAGDQQQVVPIRNDMRLLEAMDGRYGGFKYFIHVDSQQKPLALFPATPQLQKIWDDQQHKVDVLEKRKERQEAQAYRRAARGNRNGRQ